MMHCFGNESWKQTVAQSTCYKVLRSRRAEHFISSERIPSQLSANENAFRGTETKRGGLGYQKEEKENAVTFIVFILQEIANLIAVVAL